MFEFINFNRIGIQDDGLRRQESFLPGNMAAICPSHDKNFQTGEIEPQLLASSKNSPFNKTHDELAFAITPLNEPYITGGMQLC